MLPRLFSLEPWRTDALDLFVGRCLTSGGVWSVPRTSDGIPTILRVIERGPAATAVCARIYEIDDQSLHTFWLELEQDASNDRITWFLYFDVIASTPRRAQDAVHNHDQPQDIEWRVTLEGEATVIDGELILVDGKTRASSADSAH